MAEEDNLEIGEGLPVEPEPQTPVEPAAEAESEPAAVAPVLDDAASSKQWFILHTYSGFEQKVAD